MPDLCPLHALLLQGARPALWGWSGRPGRGSRSGTEHSLATGCVHQQGDEGGGGRADAVQGQHGVLALLLAYHVVCGDCRVSACHPCCLWYPLHSTHVFLNVSRLSCSVPLEAWASSSYSAGVQHLGSCTLNPKGAAVFLGPLQFYSGGPLPVPQVPIMGSDHRGFDQVVFLPPTPLLAPVPTDLSPR